MMKKILQINVKIKPELFILGFMDIELINMGNFLPLIIFFAATCFPLHTQCTSFVSSSFWQ